MRLLLDTHVWLWTLIRPERIPEEIQTLLSDSENELYLSAASSWEIGIKYRLGKLPLPEPPATFVPPRLVRDDVRPLPVQHHHVLAVAELPDHHSDPFDRLLIAQAQQEGLTLISADIAMESYDVDIRLI